MRSLRDKIIQKNMLAGNGVVATHTGSTLFRLSLIIDKIQVYFFHMIGALSNYESNQTPWKKRQWDIIQNHLVGKQSASQLAMTFVAIKTIFLIIVFFTFFLLRHLLFSEKKNN